MDDANDHGRYVGHGEYATGNGCGHRCWARHRGNMHTRRVIVKAEIRGSTGIGCRGRRRRGRRQGACGSHGALYASS